MKWQRLPQFFTPTHETDGLPGYPAIDNFWPAGTLVFPPENGIIFRKHFIPWSPPPPDGNAVGGWTCYLRGNSGAVYFLTHFKNVRRDGRVWKFQSIGRVAAVPHAWWPPHIHEGKHKPV